MRPRLLFWFPLLGALALASCRSRGPQADGRRSFPGPEIPAICTDSAERRTCLTVHFWDRFLSGDGPCDSGTVLGCPRAEVERQLAQYIGLLDDLPLAEGQERMRDFFRQVEARQAADPASPLYLQMEEMVSHYLYDPDSPLRSEDLYLPYVEGLAASPFTREEARPGYEYQREMCSLAPTGSVAPDFRLTDARGRTRRLHEIRAERTLLFFSNPGCSACREIVRALRALPGLDGMIADGRLSVVSVYIDGDLDLWREHLSEYPRGWLCAYEPDGLVRSDRVYNIRAITSLYLLDRDKRILLKDAPVERVAACLEN